MISAALSLHPIKTLVAGEKVHLPVSVTWDESGTEMVISRYGDDVWDLWPYIHHENISASEKRIDWRMKLKDGFRLTDLRHAILLESAKDFILSLSREPIEGRQRPTMLTVKGRYKHLKPLLSWMVDQGVNQFEQLAGRAMDYVPIARRKINGHMLALGTAYLRLTILEDIYLQRKKLNDALRVYPWPHESSIGLAGVDQSGRRKPKTKRIPEAVVRQLAPEVFSYLERAEVLLDARDAVDTIDELGIDNSAKGQQLRADKRRQVCCKFGFSGTKKLQEELSHLRIACYIIISLFSGIRDSELLALEHHCVSHGQGVDGVDLTWIHGVIYKTDDPKHKWLVPSIVEDAIQVMVRYSKPYREKLLAEGELILRRLAKGNLMERERTLLVTRLSVAQNQKDKLFLSWFTNNHSIQVLSHARVRELLKEFCSDRTILGEDGKPWNLSSHQFRRTYAYFVASAELGDLQYLREHFGHRSLDMTLLYADEATDQYNMDSDLLNEICIAKYEKQEGVLRHYLLEDIPMASGELMLADLRRTIHTAKNKEEILRDVSENVVLTGTGHSWCIGNVKGTGCGGLCVFEADMCVDCSYAMIGPEHLHVWKEIAEQQLAVLKMFDLGKPGKARAKRILDKAQQVISKLEGVT